VANKKSVKTLTPGHFDSPSLNPAETFSGREEDRKKKKKKKKRDGERNCEVIEANVDDSFAAPDIEVGHKKKKKKRDKEFTDQVPILNNFFPVGLTLQRKR
jgi:hypothetical protein